MLNKKEFEGMRHNPLVLDGRYIWDVYPMLQHRQALCRVPEHNPNREVEDEDDDDFGSKASESALSSLFTVDQLNDLVCYVVLVAQRVGNPLSAVRAPDEKRKIAKQLLGLSEDSMVLGLIESSHWWYLMVLKAYFELIGDMDYEQWWTLRSVYHRNMAFLREPVSGSKNDAADAQKRQALAKEADNLAVQIRRLEAKLFTDEVTREDMQLASTSDSVLFWAEKFADDIVAESGLT